MAAPTAGLSTSGRIFFGSLCVGTFGLGCWQTQRYSEKINLVAKREKDLSMEPELLDDSRPTGLRRRIVQGKYRHEFEVLVGPRGPPPGALASAGPSSGRSGGGMASSPQGFFVITPFETVAGKTILINRGWVPRQFADGTSWDRPAETVSVIGVPTKGEVPRFMMPQHNFEKIPPRFFWMDKGSMEQIAGIPEGHGTMLLQVRQDDNDGAAFPVQPPLETVGEFKTTPFVHAGYAVTWFGLSAAGIYMTRKLITRGRA